MGNDGGSIPKRRELVKAAAHTPTLSELKATTLESLSHAWTIDPLSSEPLDLDNIASDWRGRLYNYESILDGLMPDVLDTEKNKGSDMTFASTGIRSLKDIVRLKFMRYAPNKYERTWACPISFKELGPTTKAVYVVPCGHVFAEAAIKEITHHEYTCPLCRQPLEEQDIVQILPTAESDLGNLKQRMEDLRARGLTHSKKKQNARKKRKSCGEDNAKITDTSGNKSGRTEDGRRHKVLKVKKSDVPTSTTR